MRKLLALLVIAGLFAIGCGGGTSTPTKKDVKPGSPVAKPGDMPPKGDMAPKDDKAKDDKGKDDKPKADKPKDDKPKADKPKDDKDDKNNK